ncbi:MAG TPA: hypothetical protein VGN12_03585, partial [Pirellulales bacterium]
MREYLSSSQTFFGRLMTAVLALGFFAGPVLGLDKVVSRKDDRERTILGQVLVKAEDGGLLLMSPDGTLDTVPPEELVSHVEDGNEFKPYSSAELAARLLKELPTGFDVHTTKHYLIAYNTSKSYAQWCGSLFEHLYGAFTNYWTRQGFELRTPEFPLVA